MASEPRSTCGDRGSQLRLSKKWGRTSLEAAQDWWHHHRRRHWARGAVASAAGFLSGLWRCRL